MLRLLCLLVVLIASAPASAQTFWELRFRGGATLGAVELERLDGDTLYFDAGVGSEAVLIDTVTAMAKGSRQHVGGLAQGLVLGLAGGGALGFVIDVLAYGRLQAGPLTVIASLAGGLFGGIAGAAAGAISYPTHGIELGTMTPVQRRAAVAGILADEDLERRTR
jgi:hypothetical protein